MSDRRIIIDAGLATRQITVTDATGIDTVVINSADRRVVIDGGAPSPFGATIPDSQVARLPPIDLGSVSGAVPITWKVTERAHQMKLIGNTTMTLSALPFGEYAFLDVVQDGTGGWTFTILLDSALPPLRYDDDVVPVQSTGHDRLDSYMLYNKGACVICSRTWLNILTI